MDRTNAGSSPSPSVDSLTLPRVGGWGGDAGTSRAGQKPGLSFETVAPAVIFLLITIFLALDLADDLVHGEGILHVGGMTIGIALSVGGLVLMIRMLSASRARERQLATALDRTRADSLKWRDQASQMLQGLGALIDRQFSEWALSPSEREVGVLLLKGLSLKEIAAARGASEPTVRQQAQAIYRKADLAGRAQLSAFFLEDLLLPSDGGEAAPRAITRPAEPSR